MELKLTTEGDPLCVQVCGRITASAVQPDPLAALLGHDVFSRRVLLDLVQSDYLDSSGVGWLLGCQKKFRDAGGRFVIHSVTPMVMQVFRLMRLSKVLEILPDATAAHEALRPEVTP